MELKCKKLRNLAEKSIEDVVAEVQIKHLNENYLKSENEKRSLFHRLQTAEEKCAKLEEQVKILNPDFVGNIPRSVFHIFYNFIQFLNKNVPMVK